MRNSYYAYSTSTYICVTSFTHTTHSNRPTYNFVERGCCKQGAKILNICVFNFLVATRTHPHLINLSMVYFSTTIFFYEYLNIKLNEKKKKKKKKTVQKYFPDTNTYTNSYTHVQTYSYLLCIHHIYYGK